ncbi:MAG: tetratricopeptide repeat protein [Thermodesulfobacteriota bacterium]
MLKNNYVLIGVIFVVALALGIIMGRSIKKGDRNLTTAKVADEELPVERSLKSPQPIKPEEMIKHYQAAIEQNPKNANAFAGLGDVYFNMRRFKDAIKAYKVAIELKPQDVDTYNDLGLAYHYTGSSEEGLKYIEEGIRVDPLFQRIWLTKGFISATVGDIKEAIKAWDQTYTIDPNTDVAQAALDFLNQYRPISLMEENKSSAQETSPETKELK